MEISPGWWGLVDWMLAYEPKGHWFNSLPVRELAWVVGQVPGSWRVRGNHTLMLLSLSFFFPSPLSKNKIKFFQKTEISLFSLVIQNTST